MELDLPGFRFHPTEEELLDFYLKHMVRGKKLQFEIITTINLYRYNPWELPGLAKIGEREWYFYVPRDRRQANGGRPSRTTERGFWKATGSDRPVRSAADPKRLIGLKKTLVYYEGRAPRGAKTDWVMNEYRLPDPPQSSAVNSPPKEDIVLCKIYRKATSMKELEQRAAAMGETTGTTTVSPNSECVADSLLELEADPQGFQLDCANWTFDDVMFVEGRKEEEMVVVAVAENAEEEEKEEVDVVGVSTRRPSLRMLELEADPEGFQLDCADLTFDDMMFVEGRKEEEMVVVAVAEDEKEEEKEEINVVGVSTRRPSLSELVVPKRNGLEWLQEPLLSQLRSPWMVADIWSPYYYSSSILNF